MFWITSALAGFYHPAEVAESSQAFREASARSGDQVSKASGDARAYASALRSYEEALDLLGDRAPADQRTRLDALEKQYNRDFATLQGFADDLVSGFDQAFLSALDRALTQHPGAVKCRGKLPDGPKLPGMRQRMKANPDCKGDDLNAALASAIDADAALKTELDALLGRDWPSVALESQPVAAVGGSRWLEVDPFFRAGMGDRLRDIQRVDDEERLEFEVAIEQGADSAALESLVAKAKQVDARTRARRASAAEGVFERADLVFAKKAPDAGWCAQPVLLGGCQGSADAEVGALLMADKKVLKELVP